MNLLVEYLLPALLISCAALLALQVAHRAPPKLKLGLAAVGLMAWLVPWSLLSLPSLLPAALPLGDWVGGSSAPISALKQNISTAMLSVAPGETLPIIWFLILVPGLAWCIFDLVDHLATVNRWRRDSRPGPELARHVAAGIAGRMPRIRVVSDSSVAVATGWTSPTIWIGDRIVDQQDLRIALTHESIHIRRRDPIWLMSIGLIARVFWFNPIVHALKRQAVLAIESSCDEECARLLGRQRYRSALARLILKGQKRRGLALAPALHSPSVDLSRLASLEARPRMSGPAWTALAAVFAACVGGVGFGAITPEEPPFVEPAEITDSSRYGYDLPPIWSLKPGETQ